MINRLKERLETFAYWAKLENFDYTVEEYRAEIANIKEAAGQANRYGIITAKQYQKIIETLCENYL